MRHTNYRRSGPWPGWSREFLKRHPNIVPDVALFRKIEPAVLAPGFPRCGVICCSRVLLAGEAAKMVTLAINDDGCLPPAIIPAHALEPRRGSAARTPCACPPLSRHPLARIWSVVPLVAVPAEGLPDGSACACRCWPINRAFAEVGEEILEAHPIGHQPPLADGNRWIGSAVVVPATCTRYIAAPDHLIPRYPGAVAVALMSGILATLVLPPARGIALADPVPVVRPDRAPANLA